MNPLDRADAATDWLVAGLSLVRVGTTGLAAVEEAGPLLVAAGAELARLPPPGVVTDITRVLRVPRATLMRSPPEHLATVLRPYEDAVLGRLVVDPLRQGIADALYGLPPRLQDAAAVVLLERILDRVGFTGGHAVHPGALRQLDRLAGEDWLQRLGPATGTALPLLSDAYADLTRCFQRVGRALHPSDITVLEQLELLERRSDRLALSQVMMAADHLQRDLPKRVRTTRRRAGHVSTKLLDDSAYPVGGFSSISTQGSIENLVSSELALMEDGPEVDLFDVRYTEGELLFYTRDETAFVRARRRFVVRIPPGLDTARFKDDGLPYQRLIMALGWVVALASTLTRWLDRQDLLIRICLPEEGLDAEMRLLSLALDEGIQAGWLRVERLSDPGVQDVLEEDAKHAPVDFLVLHHPVAPVNAPAHTWLTELTCEARPTLTTPFLGAVALPQTPLEAWRHALLHTLTDLL